jgi:hypothetical protein
VIHVEPQPEPADFDAKVRQPGLLSLARRKPKSELPTHWRKCLPQLWEAYRGLCAYLVLYIPRGTGSRTVDHFVAKNPRPELAYEWSNFRLACSLMNTRKLEFDDVLDPFEVEDGWFTLELSTLEVLPAANLAPEIKDRVERTIRRLKLNDAECLAARGERYDDFLRKELTWSGLEKHFPFLTRELVRQGLVNENGERE